MLFRSLGHFHLHLGPIVAVKAITLDDGRVDAVAIEDVLEGTLDRSGAGPRGPRDGHDRMLL